MKIAVVGATGLVGRTMLEILKEHSFPYTSLLLVASERSVGKKITYENQEYTIIGMEEAVKQKPDIAIFSAGGSVSLAWAPKFAEVGTTVIDNSSAWRMHPDYKLIVPEINAHLLSKTDKIIANPNCSTIQLVMAIAPLHQKFGIKRLVISTYQSITGTGSKAVTQLENEINHLEIDDPAYPHRIHKNVIPHCDVFESGGYTKEELKLVNETQKILNTSISITATAVRVPVVGGHSESINIELKEDASVAEIKQLLSETEGITLQDNPDKNEYPMPYQAHGKDDVFVGRIRKDFSNPNTFNLWVVADNLRKGAATNAVQIAKYVANL